MKHLSIGLAAIAALAISAPVWAQPAPSTAPPPGVNAPAPTAAPVQSMNRMPAGGRATSERGARGSVARGHHSRHAVHPAGHPSGANSQTEQLNRQELSQVTGRQPNRDEPDVGRRAGDVGRPTQ